LDRKHRFRRAGVVTLVATAVVLLAGCADSGPKNQQNATSPEGPYSEKILNLFIPFFWIGVLIGVLVLVATIYVAMRFRVKPGEERAPKQTHGNSALEISWTIVPAVILAIMAVPTVATIFELAKKPTGPEVVNVTVTGRQWWWQFTYNDGSNLETANELHIPIGRPITLSLVGPPACSGDNCYNNGVLHSFWVPELNGKKDVVPGRNQFLKLFADKPGTYRGQCAEYCGSSHADMRLRVIAHTQADYDAWKAEQLEAEPEENLLAGVQTTQWGCATCHSFVPNKGGGIGPNLANLADRDAFAGDIYEMNYENLWQWIHNAESRKPSGDLANSDPPNWMPNFTKTPSQETGQPMTEAEAQEIACFLLKNTASTPARAAEVSKGCP
jgi:cytochrome c oxidase subunit II